MTSIEMLTMAAQMAAMMGMAEVTMETAETAMGIRGAHSRGRV
jgi:hypothetical protein